MGCLKCNSKTVAEIIDDSAGKLKLAPIGCRYGKGHATDGVRRGKKCTRLINIRFVLRVGSARCLTAIGINDGGRHRFVRIDANYISSRIVMQNVETDERV